MLGRPSGVGGGGMAVRSHIGSYVGRQSRFDARSWRRYGDWSVLGIDAALLWLEDDVDQSAVDQENLYGY